MQISFAVFQKIYIIGSRIKKAISLTQSFIWRKGINIGIIYIQNKTIYITPARYGPSFIYISHWLRDLLQFHLHEKEVLSKKSKLKLPLFQILRYLMWYFLRCSSKQHWQPFFWVVACKEKFFRQFRRN